MCVVTLGEESLAKRKGVCDSMVDSHVLVGRKVMMMMVMKIMRWRGLRGRVKGNW